MEMRRTAQYLGEQGWRVLVRVNAATARVEVRTDRISLDAVSHWFHSTLTEGMSLSVRPLRLWDRLALRGNPVRIVLRGFTGLERRQVALYAPVVGIRERKRLAPRKTQRFDHAFH